MEEGKASRLVRVRDWVRRHPYWSAAIGLAVALVLWGVLKPKRYDYAYVTQPVGQGEVVRAVTAAGKVRALNTIKVGAEVSGQITRVYVDFNTPVRAGQVLAEIDPTRVDARVAQARAQVASAQAALANAQAGVVRSQTDIAVQDREFARRAALADKGFVSKSQLDLARNALAVSRAGTRTSAAQVESARAQIAQANAELSAALQERSRTTIVAPASGVVINKLVEPGTTVVASFQTPNLFEIAADTTRMQVEASVDEADIGQVVVGQSVRFTVDSYPEENFAAVVRQVRQAATETGNVVSYLVILDVDNRGGKLLPGMTANVQIVTGQKARVTRVPTTALRFRPRLADRPKAADADTASTKPPTDVPTVWVATADPYKPARRAVKLGLQGEDYAEVLSGLKPGEKILIRSRATTPKKGADTADDEGDDADTAS